MIAPYMAVALQTTVRHAAKRDDVVVNLTHIEAMIDLVTHICSLELPVRLITLGEGAISFPWHWLPGQRIALRAALVPLVPRCVDRLS